MISSSVGSDHAGKYSYEILLEKIISIKHNHQSNLGFFSNSHFPSRINRDFFRAALVLERPLLHTFQSNYFDAIVSFSEQLFLQNSCFFKEILFQKQSYFRSYYFRIVSSFILLSLIVARCQSLSLAVIRCTTHCHFCQSFSTRCYSLSLVCLFIKDRFNQ